MSTFDCTDIKAILSGLVDDQLDADTRHLAERHLSGCASCRALVSEAESLDEIIALDARSLTPAALPDDFVGSVLSRTVYARMYEQAGWSWTSWTGWLAAAACLGLAVSIWFLDRNRMNSNIESGMEARNPAIDGGAESPFQVTSTFSPRSWTYDGDVSFASDVRTFAVDDDFQLDDATRQAIDEQLALMEPTRGALEQITRRAPLSPEDALTLSATAGVLQMLIDSDLTSFADLERVRQIASYDELPSRLADVRQRLRPADRAAVLAAESIILRIVNGPVDLDDLRMLHDTVASMNLATQIGAIGHSNDSAATSL
jgi:hypothetical protein